MLRISREQLAERWALTYRQDGYDVAENTTGEGQPRPHLEATKGNERVQIYIIDSPEALEDADTREELQTLNKARSNGTQLHIVVAAECAHAIKERLDQWQVEADLVHVT
jgi:hypothetical protein